jgi:hypothetical protein
MINFIFNPITWKIIIVVLTIVIFVSIIQYTLQLRDHNPEARGTLFFVFGMMICMILAFKILLSTIAIQ